MLGFSTLLELLENLDAQQDRGTSFLPKIGALQDGVVSVTLLKVGSGPPPEQLYADDAGVPPGRVQVGKIKKQGKPEGACKGGGRFSAFAELLLVARQ